jgi:long-chain acyl-CoA synthetase
VDPEGYLTIVDRLKDVINTGGELVYSTEVENTLYGHPAVQEAAVIAVPDIQWGEAVHAVVVAREGHTCSVAELIAHCKDRLAGFKVPRSIEVQDVLPKTGSGKIDKKSLREPFWAGEDKQVR